MNIRINRKLFVDALQVGSSFAGRSKALSVLDNVKIDVKGGYVYIMSNSVQCSIVKRVGYLGCDGDGMFLVNPNDLLKPLKSLKDSEIVIDVSSNTLSITHKKGKIAMSVQGADEYPQMEKVSNDDVYTFDSGRLYDWLSIARDFVSTDDLRPIMCGMLLYARDNRVGVCATDTRRLFTDSYSTPTLSDIQCVIPSVSFAVLQQVLQGTESVDVTLDAKYVSFKTDDSRLTCQVQVGTYPDFNRVIPTNNDISVKVGKDDFIDSVNRVSLFADKGHSLLRMDIQGMMCCVSGRDVMYGKMAHEECMCEHDGEDLSIGTNAEMMLTCLSHVCSDTVEMLFSNSSRPILFKDNMNADRITLLMPMLLND